MWSVRIVLPIGVKQSHVLHAYISCTVESRLRLRDRIVLRCDVDSSTVV
jgi:hypothetical protein